MKVLHRHAFSAVVFAILMLAAPQAHAACTSPAGLEGEILYNSDYKVVQYCDNTNWVRLGGVSPVSVMGANKQLQYNDGGALAAALTLGWDKGNGRLGVGTLTPNVTLDVAGAIVSRATDAGAGTSIDFSLSNVAYTSAACGAITLSGMQDGGSYTLVTTGSGVGPASFTHAGLSVKTAQTLTCATGKHTVFTFIRAGANVYVTMIAGY